MDFLTGFLLLAAAFPLDSIQVEGLKRLKPQQVIAASGLKIGQAVDKPDFDAAQARLVASGSIASAGYSYSPSASGKGYRLTFEITEVDQVFPLQFEDINKPEPELLKVLAASDPLFTNPAPGTEPVIKRYQSALTAYLKADPPIVGRVWIERPGEEVILFRPNTPRPTVAAVTFSGNQAFTTADLQNRMAAVAIGTLFTEARFRELLANQIKPLYETKGLLRVAFPKVTATPGAEGLNISVEVDEGAEFKLDEVKIMGAPGAAELLKAAAFKQGDVFRLNEVVDGLERLRAAMRSIGYMKVATNATREYHDKQRTVDMIVAVTPGPRYKMGTLEIKGLDITTEPVIRKMWGLKEDSYFRDGYPDKFLQSVREQGIFDNLGDTKTRLVHDEPAERINVVLEFAGKKPEPKKKREF
jgi:outer membrane protein assembly factor BamA